MTLPLHTKSRRAGYKRKGSPLWNARPAIDWEAPQIFGQYPQGFIPWACRVMRCERHRVLHVCSGALPPSEGIRVDVKPSRRPDIVASGEALPLAAGSVHAVMIDPPYTEQYARDLYGTDYPRPGRLIREALRVVEPGGPIGFLHFIVPIAKAPIEAIYGVTTGPGYAARAFTVFRKPQADLFD